MLWIFEFGSRKLELREHHHAATDKGVKGYEEESDTDKARRGEHGDGDNAAGGSGRCRAVSCEGRRRATTAGRWSAAHIGRFGDLVMK
jgi:hypothetical protein